MTPPQGDDGISEQEELRVRQNVVDGLELALDDVIPDGMRREITKTEREKLIYFAVREFDLPITYSWYLAGAKTAFTPDSPVGTTSPEAPSVPTPDEFVQPEASDTDPEVQRYREFFRSQTFFDDYDLRTVYFTSNADFLCDVYEEFAREEYTDLYIHSTRLREKLRSLNESIDRGTPNASLTDWGAGAEDGWLSPHQEEEIRRLVSDLHLDLGRLDGFGETRTPVTKGTDVIESVLTKLTHVSSLNVEQTALVNGLGEFFYEYVWKYPALKISADTATGPNAGIRKRQHGNIFRHFDGILQERIDELSEQHQRAGLDPTMEEIVANENSEAMAFFHSTTREVIDPTK